MAFSKVKVGGLADDSVTAANVDDDGTGYTVGNLTNSGTLQQTGQVTLGTGSGSGGNWTLPTSRGSNDKYVLQINGTTGASTWEQSLTAPEISSHNYDVSGSTDDGGINAYEAPYAYTGNTTDSSTTISNLSSDTGVKVGQYISGPGIPANTTISSITNSTTIVISNQATAAASGVALKIQKTPGEKNGGKVILTGTNFGANVADISVALTNSSGTVIANASYLSGLSGTSVTAEWTGTEGTYSTDLTSSYGGKIYFKITKSGLASGVYDTNTNLTTDATLTTLTTSSQTGGDRSATPSATSLGTYGDGRIAGGGQDSNTKVLLNFDRGGGTDIEDSSNTGGDGYKVTAYNQASIKASPFGDGKTAMFFDGSNDKLSMSGHADFQFQTADFTVEQWVYFDTVGADQGIWAHTGDGTNASPELALYFEESTDRITLRRDSDEDSGGSKNFQCSWSPIAYRWYHVALVRYSNQLYIYVDGVALPQVTNSSGVPFENGNVSATNTLTNMATNKNFLIGCDQDDGRHFQGYIDSFRIVSSAVYTGSFTVPTSRLSTTWAANPYGGSNTVANSTAANTKLLIHSNQSGDSSSRQHTLSLHAPAFHGSSPARANWGGSNLVFDGSDDKIRISANPDFELLGTVSTSTNRTIDFWVYHTTNPASGGKMYLCQYDASSPYWEIRLDGANINFSGSGSTLGISAAHGMSVNTWYHIAVTKVGTACKIYVGGVLKGSGTQSGTLDLSSNLLTIGARQHHGDMFWAGYMDEIRISDIDRTAAGQDLALSGTSFTPPTGAYTSDSNTTLLIHGDGAKFTDSSSTGHTITPTGAFHSQDHKGIVSSQPWPANGKKFGSSGVYFDGATDYLELGAASALGTGKFTIDFWMNFKRSDSTGNYVPIMGNSQSPAGYFNINLKKVGSAHNFYVYEDSTQNDSGYAVDDGLWHHCMVTRNSDSYLELWVDGTRRYVSGSTATTNYNSSELWRIGHDDQQSFYYKGYLDNIRIVIGEDMTSVSTDQVYSANGTTYTLPTRSYGTFGQKTPDAGTVTLVATGSGDYTWSELSAGTALPGSLAVGSTTHSGSGDSRTHTATITGSFSEDTTSTFTNGARSDVSTNNILLKAQNDADSTKAITLGSSGGYDGIGITQKSTEKPVLFNARRYVGTGAIRDINNFGFAPDLVWIKNRNSTASAKHELHDSVNGTHYRLNPDDNTALSSADATRLSAFTSDGFSLGNSTSQSHNQGDGDTYIAWAWKAGGSIGSGTAPSTAGLYKLNGESTERTATTYPVTGSGYAHGKSSGAGDHTTYEASYNVDVGFAIIKTTSKGDGTSGNTFPTFIGDPDVIFAKQLDSSNHWFVYHKSTSLTSGMRSVIYLNLNEAQDATTGSTNGFGTDVNIGANSGKTWDLGSNNATNNNGTNNRYVYYLWKAVAGLSAFGEYTGTANVTTNFRPRLLIVKRKSGTGNWFMFDGFREGTDAKSTYILADTDGSENSTSNATATFSNTGFTTGSHDGTGGSGSSYIYMAYA